MRASFIRVIGSLLVAWGLTQLGPVPAWAQSKEIQALNTQALQLHRQGKYGEALVVAERALSLAEKELGPEHPDTLVSVNNLGLLNAAQGRYGEAELLYKRMLAGHEKVLGPEHPDTLASVNILAILYQAQRRYSEAEPLHKRALQGFEKTLGTENPLTLMSVSSLGGLYSAQGRHSEAERLLKRALAGNENALGKEHPHTLKSISSLGEFYFNIGRYSEAEPLMDRALQGFEKALGPEHLETLAAINDLGTLYDVQGRSGEAEPLHKRALAGREKALGLEHPETLKSVNNLGYVYFSQRRYEAAEPLYKRALAGYERALGQEHPDTLRGVNNLGGLYDTQGRYDEAEPLYRRALVGRDKALGPEHPVTLQSANNLGALYHKQGRNNDARPLLQRALAGREKALGREHPDTLRTVANLGTLSVRQERNSEAKLLFERALAGQEKALGLEHPETLQSVSNLAGLHFIQKDWRTAAQFWRRSTVAIAKRLQRSALSAGLAGNAKSEAQMFDWHFWGLIKAIYRIAPEGSATDVASREMFQTAQFVLNSEAAQSLAQMAARGAKRDPVLAALVRERQDLADEWQRAEKIQAATLGQDTAKRDAIAEAQNNERMAVLDRRIAEIDARLRNQFPEYFAQANPGPLSIEDAQAQLGADEALVLFLDTQEWEPTPEETFIWMVTKTDVRWLRSDLGQATLIREVQALRCGLDRTMWESQSPCFELTGRTRPDELLPFDHVRAHRLYKAIFGQAEDLIKGKHLLIVASGALTQLPFAVLVHAPPGGDNKSPAWLARQHAITMLPAVSSLQALRATAHPSAATKPMIGFGNPLLVGPDERYRDLARRAVNTQRCRDASLKPLSQFPDARKVIPPRKVSGLANVEHLRALAPLPETADELCAVASQLGADDGEIRLGARATEHEVKALSGSGELARYRIVHFATHGAMAGELNSLNEPGLVLTPPGKATSGDDGYLSASEIAALKLDADWVILSACNTAAGNKESAEALSGLARAFIYAQARALLVSHWAVDSQATVKLITSAIRQIARDKNVGRAEALRRAMLVLIDSADPRERHPSSWAPFIVVGEGTR